MELSFLDAAGDEEKMLVMMSAFRDCTVRQGPFLGGVKFREIALISTVVGSLGRQGKVGGWSI